MLFRSGRYFALDFDQREIREKNFKEVLDCSFFDWDNHICIASEFLKKKYEKARGNDGCNLFKYFIKRNDLKKMEDKKYKQIIKQKSGFEE